MRPLRWNQRCYYNEVQIDNFSAISQSFSTINDEIVVIDFFIVFFAGWKSILLFKHQLRRTYSLYYFDLSFQVVIRNK